MGEDLFERLVEDEIAISGSVHGSIGCWDDAWQVVQEMRACTGFEGGLLLTLMEALQSREVSDG